MIPVRAPRVISSAPDWPSFVCLAFAGAVTFGLLGFALYWFIASF